MVEVLGTNEGEAGKLTKKSGRRGQRLESFERAAEQHGKVHPDLLNEENEVQGLLVSHDEYLALCEEHDDLPDKGLTDGVKSGAKDRYGVKFGRTISGDSDKYMIVPNNDKFTAVMNEAQEAVDEQMGEDDDEADEEDPQEADAEAEESDEDDSEEDEE